MWTGNFAAQTCCTASSDCLCTSWQVSVTILDENDNSPEFDITSDVSVEIPESTPIGKRVAVVLARDKDAGNNGLVRREGVTYGNTEEHLKAAECTFIKGTLSVY